MKLHSRPPPGGLGIKVASRQLELGGATIRLAGMCKGAGMIGPQMATMLAVVMTDAVLTSDSAQTALKTAVEESFNCISVEGHMSTNDTVLLLASGAATKSSKGGLGGGNLAEFQAALNELCIELARQIPDDGEGASHLITLDVHGARSKDDARRIARTIADSALMKTAIAGGDPNWGRIVSAAGYAGVPFDPTGVDLAINGFLLYERGAPATFDAKAVSTAIKSSRETSIVLTLREGPANIRFWTSDLNVEYVRFNADYTT
jgi:glutamate N-acetyltransferase/amino-acid N-acetyltransferase